VNSINDCHLAKSTDSRGYCSRFTFEERKRRLGVGTRLVADALEVFRANDIDDVSGDRQSLTIAMPECRIDDVGIARKGVALMALLLSVHIFQRPIDSGLHAQYT